MAIKNKLKVLRAKRNMTQKKLAEKTGLTRQSIHAIETGKFEPGLSVAFKISKAFGKPIEKIFKHKKNK